MPMEFEWHSDKAESNWRKHGVRADRKERNRYEHG